MVKIFAVVTLVLLVLTLGCGFVIRYGGEDFQAGMKGHMILGVAALISMVILLIAVYRQ